MLLLILFELCTVGLVALAFALAWLKLPDEPLPKKDPLSLIFRRFDADGSGKIDREELGQALRQALGTANAPNESELIAIIAIADKNNDNEIDIHEFHSLVHTLTTDRDTSKAGAAFLQAVALEQSKLGDLANKTSAALRVVVPGLMCVCLLSCVYASLKADGGLFGSAFDVVFAPEVRDLCGRRINHLR